MPEVNIEVAGKVYRVGCGAGEEAHLVKLAKTLDDEAVKLSQNMGQVPEARLMLMSALMLADRLHDAAASPAAAEPVEDLAPQLAKAEDHALELEAKAAEAEVRALEMEAKLAETETRAKKAEAQKKEAEAAAEDLAKRVGEAEAALKAAEKAAADAKKKLSDADARTAQAENRAVNAEKLAKTPAQPSDLINPEREEEIAKSLDALAERIEALAGRVELPV